MSKSLVNRRNRGVSLVEISITTALAVLAGSALPSPHGMLMQRALNGRAAELVTDLQYLRSEALTRNEGLRISIHSSKAGSCYVLHSGPAKTCDCLSAQGTSCTGQGRSIKSVFLPAGAAVQFDANVGRATPQPRRRGGQFLGIEVVEGPVHRLDGSAWRDASAWRGGRPVLGPGHAPARLVAHRAADQPGHRQAHADHGH